MLIGYARLSTVRKNRLSEPLQSIFAKILKLRARNLVVRGMKIGITKRKADQKKQNKVY
jgi:hypothetical protein